MRARWRRCGSVWVPVLSVACASLACSGAASSELFEDRVVARDDTSPEGQTAPPNGGDAPVSPPQTQPATQPGTSSTNSKDRPNEPTCAAEAEPNDSLLSATVFETSLCGKLDPKDEVDVWKWQAPNSAARFHISHSESSGHVAYKVFVNGENYVYSQLETVPFVANATYVFRVSLPYGSEASPTYEVDVKVE